ncbi:TfuA-like protein [uncultured Hoeflea sp.]|uniref:TfuA-like protein n=1 Tax=uncultured Hoeflea sp. TaxID=538666 RepID=UPI00262B42F3|nr:TfuA-like protein [uncultured Hoeflea sp.]
MVKAPFPQHVFVGPSLFPLSDIEFRREGRVFHEPAKRHSVSDLCSASSDRGTIALIDGYFNESMAVSHREICEAIELGWSVIGCSSIGAIRAAEMVTLGMQGFGAVFELFAGSWTVTDDEVALLHAPFYPYEPITEPLVHFRFALDELTRRCLMEQSDAADIFEDAKTEWFGRRSLAFYGELLVDRGVDVSENFGDIGQFFQVFQQKRFDCIELLETLDAS